jgi:hypothetical protein
MNNNQIKIKFYKDWMFDQVIQLFIDEYNFDAIQYREFFKRFYETPFQRAHGIRIVAVEGETICGFQSYFYWPYNFQGKTLRTFQSGSSIISSRYRGRQIFAQLLNFIDNQDSIDRMKIDFLIGFPVKMSFGSFMRNKWTNPLNLVWYAKPINPFSIVKAYSPEHSDWCFQREPGVIRPFYNSEQFCLSKETEFSSWRRLARDFSPQYLYFNFVDSSNSVVFELKPNRRGRINELVVGDIIRSSPDPKLLRAALNALIDKARKENFLAILTIALNEELEDKTLVQAVRECGFIRLSKKIHFIVKPISGISGCTDAIRWNLLRSDIDTW